MDGGSFYSGSSSESIPHYLKAKSGGAWRGHKLSNCEDALLRNTVFENISPYPVDSTYALELTDCGIPGSQFARLVDNEFRAAGQYAVEFDGASLASGVYFCRMEAGKFAGTKRMVLIK
ncbi:MAG: hypothetical protein K1X85_03855 [Ignavibacteria bacterium]|nr:hypothetical protein [Ignavibacteria bacterium]